MNTLVVVILCLLLIGAGCIVAGIDLVFGLGWALIACGAIVVGFAVTLRLGLTNG